MRLLPARRRGLTIVLVLAFIVVAAILALGVHWLTRSERGSAYHALQSEACHQAALGAARAALQYYGGRIGDPADPLHKALVEGAGDHLPLPDFDPSLHPDLAALVDDLGRTTLRVTAALEALEPLRTGGDPAEKRGELRLAVSVEHRGERHRYAYARRFLFTTAVPPVVSRFTLFVRHSAGERFNALPGGADGLTSGGKPLVLVNGRGGELARNGWIYLGGERTVLNLARGEENFGEDFQLPDAITRSIFFPDQDYALLHLNTGFYAEAGRDPVFERFPVKGAFAGSALRLFSCPAAGAEASPTLVIGDVWRRYLQAAAIGPVRDGSLVAVALLPWIVNPADGPRDPAVPPFLFLSSRLGQVYMSQVREEPYNRSYDFIRAGAGSPPSLLIKELVKGDFADPYPLAEPDITLRNPRGDLVYAGKLKDFDLAPFLTDRIGRTYGSLDAFLDAARDADDGTVRIAGFTRIRNAGKAADLAARGPLAFTGQGTLVFEGAVRLGSVAPVAPATDRLSIVALAGDISAGNGEVAAGLVALGGRVDLAATRVRGFVACDRLDPERIRSGGTIEFDGRTLAGAGGDTYAFQAGDRVVRFLEEDRP